MTITATERPVCFVIMPISDCEPYEVGHFARVYDHIIKPACHAAGFAPVRADDVRRTNNIALDVLRQIVEAPMALSDLSGRNPNVMYELGLRHAFNKPVTLIKDSVTERVFDIQGFRDLEYDVSLRVDTVEPAISGLATMLRNTCEAFSSGRPREANSLVQLLGITAAALPEKAELSGETGILLGAIQEIGERLRILEQNAGSTAAREILLATNGPNVRSTVGQILAALPYQVGDSVAHPKFGEGRVIAKSPTGILTVEFPELGRKRLVPQYANLVRLTENSPNGVEATLPESSSAP